MDTGVRTQESTAQVAQDSTWWRSAAIYQIYVRSFADGNADGIGDLRGVRERLPYLAELGVDALWFNPWYPSPFADGGYDISDYRDIHPWFGTLTEAEELISEARAYGIRTIIDIVPNHVSDQHPWFREAIAAEPGDPARDRFWFHTGKGADGATIPTNWVSSFQGTTWTRTTQEDGRPGEWYLHLFTPEQPDLNWNHEDVRREHEDILRFWFDRGVAGVRIDSAALLVKDPALSEVGQNPDRTHPTQDRDELHDIYRSWRAIADGYAEPRVLVGELWLEDAERFAAYLRPDELHTAFNFDFMTRPYGAESFRASIDQTLRAHASVAAPCTWVLSNHDVTRPVTRYGRENTGFAFLDKRFGTPTDLVLGARRARAVSLVVAALPGCLYIYQGDELGLPEVEDLPRDRIEDPMHFRSGGVDPGRDGCRVPLPWSGRESPFGFGEGAEPWLPQPDDWASRAVAVQSEDPRSMLELYRRTLHARRQIEELRTGDFAWSEDFSPEVLAFRRGDDFLCLLNTGAVPVPLPSDATVLVASEELFNRLLPRDTAVWLQLASAAADGNQQG